MRNLPTMTEKRFQILNIESKQIEHWTIEQILNEINRDRSEEWTKYDQNDWQEGWRVWIENEGFFKIID